MQERLAGADAIEVGAIGGSCRIRLADGQDEPVDVTPGPQIFLKHTKL
jgi:hypothetical protein